MATGDSPVKIMIAAFMPLLYLPGIIVGLIPVLLTFFFLDEPGIKSLTGFYVLLPAAAGILYCSWLFASHGQSIAPWETPKKLIKKGPYGFTRNPVFIFMIQASVGWALIYQSHVHLAYTLLLLGIFQYRIKKEEQVLQRLFPRQWAGYCLSTPRWLF